MTHLVTSEKYQSDGINIEEILVELNDDEISVDRDLEPFDSDAVIIVQNIVGEAENRHTLPVLEREFTENGKLYQGSVYGGGRLSLNFLAAGFAKVKVFIAQVRQGFTKAFRAAPCKLCKLAVKTVISTILVQLGVPMTPTGEFDLRKVLTAITGAANDIANGLYGQVVEALSSLLPTNWWNTVLSLLHGANWLLDATDAFFEKICQLIGMCPKAKNAAP